MDREIDQDLLAAVVGSIATSNDKLYVFKAVMKSNRVCFSEKVTSRIENGQSCTFCLRDHATENCDDCQVISTVKSARVFISEKSNSKINICRSCALGSH